MYIETENWGEMSKIEICVYLPEIFPDWTFFQDKSSNVI